MHEEKKGKLETASKVKVTNKDELSIAYTPGVAEPSRVIAKNKELAYKYTIKGNTVAVVSDGSAVLGLGNIGPYGALPVMEGKAVLFKEFANIDAFPIVVQDGDKIVETVRQIAPGFGGINLEDIAAPWCFEVEEQLQDLGIPVMHDDQHGTAVVVYAALINACKVTGKNFEELEVVIMGAGAAGIAIAKMLGRIEFKSDRKVKNIVMLDSKGIICKDRANLNPYKELIAAECNSEQLKGGIKEAVKGADVFIGVSVANVLTAKMVSTMNKPIVLAMANPEPEIMPDEARKGGAVVVGTGRSDFPNQINNVLAFPGIFRGALDARAPRITDEMKLAAAYALAESVKPTKDMILPNPLDKKVAYKVAKAVKKAV